MKRVFFNWTDEARGCAAEMHIAGKRARAIAEELGFTKNAVLGFIYRNRDFIEFVREDFIAAPMEASSALVSGPDPISPVEPKRAVPKPRKPRTKRVKAEPEEISLATLESAPVDKDVAEGIALPSSEVSSIVPLSLRVTIVQLKETMCKWPLGDPTSSEFRYCGSPSPGASPYCTHHGKLAYQSPQERRREWARLVSVS